MPTAPLHPCPGCHKTLVAKGRCHECAQQHELDRRPAHIAKFYSSKPWQNARNLKRRQNPLCEDCLQDAEHHGVARTVYPVQVVDHIVPLTQDFSRRLHMDNLRSLCHAHHALKTRRTRQ